MHLHLTNLAEERQRASSLRREDGEFGGSADTGDIGPAVGGLGPDARAPDRADADPPGAHRAPHRGAARGGLGTAPDRRQPRRARRRRDRAPRSVPRPGRRMLEDIDILQRTSTLRITRPTPADEVKTVLTVFRQSLVHAVPRFQRAVEVALGGDDPGAPPLPPIVRFGSWVGGDRDGNPFVTAEVTRETVAAPRRPGAADPARRRRPGGARMITVDEESTTRADATRASALSNDAGPTPGCSPRSPRTPRRAAPPEALVVAARLDATRRERAGLAYAGPDGPSATSPGAGLAGGRRRRPRRARRAAGRRVDAAHVRLPPRRARGAPAQRGAPGSAHRAARVLPVGGGRPTDPAATASDAVALDRLAVDGWPSSPGR